MTDTPLLRLASIVAELARVTYDWKDARCVIAEQLVRDLEAAPPPEPARRTITAEQFRDLADRWSSSFRCCWTGSSRATMARNRTPTAVARRALNCECAGGWCLSSASGSSTANSPLAV